MKRALDGMGRLTMPIEMRHELNIRAGTKILVVWPSQTERDTAGRMLVPISIRDALGVTYGSKVDWILDEDGLGFMTEAGERVEVRIVGGEIKGRRKNF